MTKRVKIVTFVPEAKAQAVRDAIHKAGAGIIGNYTYCSFCLKGTGRFRPGEGAHPNIGKVGRLEEVSEERIEVTCNRDVFKEVIEAIKKAHPYEEPVIDVYSLEEI